ncbi:MAG: glutamate 5-kinase [Pirellulales bacterium]
MMTSKPDPSRKAITSETTLIVVKIGTRVLTRPDGLLDTVRIESLGRQIDSLLASGKQVVLVSSGAVGAGMGRLGLQKRPKELAHLQAIAAVGQSSLIEAYERVLRAQGRHAAQVLLVADDFKNRSRYLNIRNTLRSLLNYNAIPIINENDTVSVEELRTSFGDNDHLAALVTTLIGASLLVLLSDVDGLYSTHPDAQNAQLIRTVRTIDESIESFAHDHSSLLSKGGMASKISAARIVTESGGHCVIASGHDDSVLPAILHGENKGTFFFGRTTALPARKRWLGWSAQASGSVEVDSGAFHAVMDAGSSLLAAGIQDVSGTFSAGDLVDLKDEKGDVFARGLVNYSSTDLQRIHGLKTDRITEVLGYCHYDEVIHRDNLAVIRRDTIMDP